MIEHVSKLSEDSIIRLQSLIGIKYRIDLVDLILHANKFEQFHNDALMMSNYEEEALNQIRCQLGYLPRREVTLPSEPAIRQLLYEYDHRHHDVNELFNRCNRHIDDIYHRDMQPHSIADYPPDIYLLYDTLFPELKERARSRILKFAEGDVNLVSSIYAELVLRCRMSAAFISFGEERTSADYEAQAVIWYRREKKLYGVKITGVDA